MKLKKRKTKFKSEKEQKKGVKTRSLISSWGLVVTLFMGGYFFKENIFFSLFFLGWAWFFGVIIEG